MTDFRPLTIALDTVAAKEVRRGDLVLNEEFKLISVVEVHSHKGFIYIGLEDGNTWFVLQGDLIRKIRR